MNRQTDKQTDMLTRDCTYGKYKKTLYIYDLKMESHTIKRYCLKCLYQLFVRTSLIYY